MLTVLIRGAALAIVPCLWLAAGPAAAQADGCQLVRALIAAEVSVRDALSGGHRGTDALEAALARLAVVDAGPDRAVVDAYLASRQSLGRTLAADGPLAARRLSREPTHASVGSALLAEAGAATDCLGGGEVGQTDPDANSAEGTVTGGHGGPPQSAGTAAASGTGQASQPGGQGLLTEPLSFLRGFDPDIHIAAALGAFLAFGTLIYVLTRDRRQYRRYVCHLPVAVEIKAAQAPSTLLDISRGGAKLARPAAAEAGLRLRVFLDTLAAPPVSARIIWANERFMGIAFSRTLSAREFQAIMRRAREGAGIGRVGG